MICSSLTFISTSYQHQILVEGSNTVPANGSHIGNVARAQRSYQSSYVDITADPNQLIIKSGGKYWINYTFEEYNRMDATFNKVELEFTNVKGYNIYPKDIRFLQNLKVPAASNASWLYKLFVKSDLILKTKQQGVNKLLLRATFHGVSQDNKELLITVKVPLELELKVALIIDNSIYNGIKEKLNRYCDDVRSKIEVEFIECIGYWTKPESLRNSLIKLWKEKDISGAILFGYFPSAMWKYIHTDSKVETFPIPIFYEDLDGDFADTDSDGYYDHHYWGANDGPEIWVSFIMPPMYGQNIPPSQLDPHGSLIGGGLLGSYYEDNDFTTFIGTREDPAIDFDWEEDALLNNIHPNNFSVRWTGKIKVDKNGNYKFVAETKGGVKLWVNNVLIIDNPNSITNYLYTYTGTVSLKAGWYDIKLEYRENDGGPDTFGLIRLSLASTIIDSVKFESFLDKTHKYYTGELDFPQNGLLFMDYCYGLQCRMLEPIKNKHLYPLFGENLVVGGGEETTNATEYIILLESGNEVTSVWSHAGSTYHHISPFNNSNGAPTAAPYWKIRKKAAGVVTLIWGCHAGDFLAGGGLENGLSRNLVANYAFNTKYGLAAAGCTRSFGTTFREVYHSWQNRSYLGLGYFAFLDMGYDKNQRINQYPAAGEDRWVDDEILMGDPFITVDHRPDDLKIVIENGKKYTNTNLVTLELSSNNPGEMSLRNEGETWTNWEPLTSTKTWQLREGLGYKRVEFRMRNSYGECFNEAYDVIGIDTNPPTKVTMVINDGFEITNNATINLAIEVVDDLSGPDKMSLSNDGVNWCDWVPFSATTTWNLTTENEQKTVYLKVLDGGGNLGPIASDSIILDTIAPKTEISIDGPLGENGWYTGEVEIEMFNPGVVTDRKNIYYRVNNQSWMNYTSSIYLNNDGYYTIEYFSIDNIGNIESKRNCSLKIDSKSPVNVTILINDGDMYTTKPEITLNISTQDELAGCWLMRFGEDGGESENGEEYEDGEDVDTDLHWHSWTKYLETAKYNFTAHDGIRSIYLEVKDEAGNIVKTPAYDDIILDMTAPTVVSVEPLDGSKDIDIRTNIKVAFSETLDEKLVTSSTMTLENEIGELVVGKIEYQKENNIMIFKPDFELDYYTTYTVILSADILDIAGNPMLKEYIFNFTTKGFCPTEIRGINLEDNGQMINVSWLTPVDPGSKPILGYKIYRRTNIGPKELIYISSPDMTTYFDKNITAGNTYHYAILAYNVVGDGPICPYVSIHVHVDEEDDMSNSDDDENRNGSIKKDENNFFIIGIWIFIISIILMLILFFIFVFRKSIILRFKREKKQ